MKIEAQSESEMNKKIQTIIENAEAERERIYRAHDYIWSHPETGYREWKTSAYLEKEFEDLGYTLVKAGNIPGFYADLDTGIPGPKVLILGEMDSLIVAGHPDAQEGTNYVHACGHSAQCAALVGIAAALKREGALDHLCGSIRLMAVPAEELIELDFRESLRREGVISYFGGKVEFMHRGYMDGVDLAVLFHSCAREEVFYTRRGGNGCITKSIEFQGISAHAGASPWAGKNALYAATLGLNAINSLRETFREKDVVRVHPIITEGGLAVNAIPEKVKMESFVRAATMEAIKTTNKKVNRALAASAAALGCGVTVRDRQGYSPLLNDMNLMEVAHEAMRELVPPEKINITDDWSSGCTDMGDVASVIPAIHPYCSGATGLGHGADYRIFDVETACVMNAKCQLLILEKLLENGARRAKEILEKKHTLFPDIPSYFRSLDTLFCDREGVVENEDGTVTLQF